MIKPTWKSLSLYSSTDIIQLHEESTAHVNKNFDGNGYGTGGEVKEALMWRFSLHHIILNLHKATILNARASISTPWFSSQEESEQAEEVLRNVNERG